MVSAQNRKRIYWTNIGLEPFGLFGDLQTTIKQPRDKGILLKDILESEVDDKYFLSEKMLNGFANRKSEWQGIFKPTEGNKKSNCITSRCYKMGVDDNYIVHNMMPRSSTTGKGGTGHLTRNDGKTYCLDTGNTNVVEIKCVAMRGRNPENPKSRKAGLNTEQQLESRMDNKTNCLTSVQKDNLVYTKNYLQFDSSGKGHKSQNDRAFYEDGKHGCLSTGRGETKTGIIKNGVIRRLTPLECERLQTVPDNYTNHVSDSQRYKMLGNGWTVDVIVHILNYMK